VIYFVPSYGIAGYIAGMVVSSICVCILDISTVIKTTGMALDFRNWIIKPALRGNNACYWEYVQSFFTIFHLGHSWTVVLTVFGNIVIGFLLMFVLGVLDKDEMLAMVGLKKVQR